jgi:phage-related minor tail protein
MSIFETPAAAAGQNVPDYAKEETFRLEREFVNLKSEVAEALDEARKLPSVVEDQETADRYTAAINRIVDLNKKTNGIREAEKTPWLRRGDAVDSFFFGLMERLLKRKKTDKAGGADVLNERLHAYNMKRLAEERARREEAERIAREAERKLREEREAREREQAEAEARARRARSDETRKAAEEAAEKARKEAAEKAAAEEIARAQRQEAEDAARAKPADMVRERHSEGMNTMRLVWHVEVLDSMELDLKKLQPFIPADAWDKAAKAWAKVTQYRQTMPGLLIEQRPDTQVRR